jgi:hypothetical protein
MHFSLQSDHPSKHGHLWFSYLILTRPYYGVQAFVLVEHSNRTKPGIFLHNPMTALSFRAKELTMETTFGQDLIAAMEEAAAHATGKGTLARTHVVTREPVVPPRNGEVTAAG